jgi:hypothetical protein
MTNRQPQTISNSFKDEIFNELILKWLVLLVTIRR